MDYTIRVGDLVSHTGRNDGTIRYGVVYDVDLNNEVWAKWRDTIQEAKGVIPGASTHISIGYCRHVIPPKPNLKGIAKFLNEMDGEVQHG